MATDTSKPLTNAFHMEQPIQFSMPLPNAPGSRIHTHLTILAASILLFCTTTTPEHSPSVMPSLGTLVYAMPDVYNPSSPLSTHLYTLPSSVDFADRLAKTLARRTNLPVHVGSSVNFSSAGHGASVDEEMDAFRHLVAVVLGQVEKARAA
jgi:hypothetical protein